MNAPKSRPLPIDRPAPIGHVLSSDHDLHLRERTGSDGELRTILPAGSTPFLRFWLAWLLVLVGSSPSHAQEAPDQIVSMGEVMQAGKPPVPTRRVAPVYPAALKQTGETGMVLVSFIVNPHGEVQNATVVKSSQAGFEQPAIDAIMGWKFQPATMNGHPVSVRLAQRIDFGVREGMPPSGAMSGIRPSSQSPTKPVRVIKHVAPTFPYAMKKAGLAGRVTLEFIVDAQGKVTQVEVVQSNNPWYERPAIDALMQWKYSPAEKDGHPTSMRTRQEFQFDPDGSPEEFWKITKGRDHENMEPEFRWDAPPKVINSVFPVYPLQALRDRVTGKARIAFVVGLDGTVQQPQVAEATTPEMGQAALAAMENWRFQPAKKNGSPCLAKLAHEISFTLENNSDAPVSTSARDILRLLKKHPEKIIPAHELDQPLEARWIRASQNTRALQQADEASTALVELYIDEEGAVQLPALVSCSRPEYGYAAVQAVATWQFEPPLKDGKPVITRARVPFHFRTQNFRPLSKEALPRPVLPEEVSSKNAPTNPQ